MYSAIVARLQNLRPFPLDEQGNKKADRLMLATVCGCQVVVGLNHFEGQIGIYFPTDGQLSEEFAKAHDLIRRTNENGKKVGGMFDENRRVRTQKFKGEVSDGFWMPIDCLNFITTDSSKYPIEGTELIEFMKVPLCNKYITPTTKNLRVGTGIGFKDKKPKLFSPMFKEHFETGQLGRDLKFIKDNALLIISEKCHGTSGRTGHVKITRTLSKFEKILLFFFPKFKINKEEWVYLNGTRSTVYGKAKTLSEIKTSKPSYRDSASLSIVGNLRKGETIFYEIVGYQENGRAIMGSINNIKMKDKSFIEQYGPITTFSYGCKPSESKILVYRITYTTEDGYSIDFNWDAMLKRCRELGLTTVPELKRCTKRELIEEQLIKLKNEEFNTPYIKLTDEEKDTIFLKAIEELVQGPSTLDVKHIREGVVIRIDREFTPFCTKHKSYEFKVLEGIIKDSGQIDVEEAS